MDLVILFAHSNQFGMWLWIWLTTLVVELAVPIRFGVTLGAYL